MTAASAPDPTTPAAGLDPVSGNNPRVLILGSFPSVKSLLHTEYYGNPQNQFWKIMEALFSVEASLPYADRIDRITRHRIALWDVIHSCCRAGSADLRITCPVFNDIPGFLLVHPTIRLVALNGNAAARFYSRRFATIAIPRIVLPSTSPANARLSLDEKIRRWEIIREKSC